MFWNFVFTEFETKKLDEFEDWEIKRSKQMLS